MSSEKDIVYAKVLYDVEDYNNEDSSGEDQDSGQEENQEAQEHLIVPEKATLETNIWSLNDNALRDLLVFLVQKHRIDDVYDSKIKAYNWEKLIEEFHSITENRVAVSKPQIIRKWHNWKQYNKARKKPHPFVVSEGLTLERVLEKCTQLCKRADSDVEFASLLSRGPVEAFESHAGTKRAANSDSDGDDLMSKKMNLSLGRRRDFLVRRTGASAAALSVKRLQHEITLENLNFECEKWRVRLENNKLIQQKVLRHSELIDVKLEKAELEFQSKREQCQSMGILVTDVKQED